MDCYIVGSTNYSIVTKVSKFAAILNSDSFGRVCKNKVFDTFTASNVVVMHKNDFGYDCASSLVFRGTTVSFCFRPPLVYNGY